jgi:drug/metabolite transporter (DMT)-like permease
MNKKSNNLTKMSSAWIVFALIASGLWGAGYTFLSPVSKQLSSYTINVVYGASLCIINLLASIIMKNTENFFVLGNSNVALSFTGYTICCILANFIYLSGYKMAENNVAAFVAISSTYPLVTLIFSYIFLGQRNLNFYFVIPGMILIIAGIILLSLAK